MRRVLDVLYGGSAALAAFFILGICLLVAAQVLMNLSDKLLLVFGYDAIGLSIPSYADFTGFFLAASSFLALAYTKRSGDHIRVTLILHRQKEKVRYYIELFSLVVAGALTIYFTYYTGRLVWESYTFQDLSSGIVSVPLWIPQFAMFAGLAILAISFLDDLICVLKGTQPSYHGKGEEALLERELAPNPSLEAE